MFEKNKDKKRIIEDNLEAGCLTMEAEQVNTALRSLAYTIEQLYCTDLNTRFRTLCNTLQFAIGNAEIWQEDKDILTDLQDVLACYH